VAARYLKPLDIIQQGDVYRNAPSVYLAGLPLGAIRTETISGGRQIPKIYYDDAEPPRGGFHWSSGEDVISRATRDRAMLLTHDCEIEKDDRAKYRMLALIRPFEAVPERDQELIRRGDRLRFFYLAPQDEDPPFPASYVDFRRITTVLAEVLPSDDRVVTLSDDMRDLLREAFARYVTRPEP
jgi:hypothetical protein